MSNSMDIDYAELEKKIKKAKSNKELDKLYKKYRDNLGLSDGNSEIEKLFNNQGNYLMISKPRTPEDIISDTPDDTPEDIISDTEFFKNTDDQVDDPSKFVMKSTNVAIRKTRKTPDYTCTNPKNCGAGSLYAMGFLSKDSRRKLESLVGENGLTIDKINDFLNSNKLDKELSEKYVSGTNIYTWAMEKMKDATCSMIILGNSKILGWW